MFPSQSPQSTLGNFILIASQVDLQENWRKSHHSSLLTSIHLEALVLNAN